MLGLIIGILTFILVVICAMLVVLILAQLPKKDAGAGLAFGAGTAEAIFGAGAGTPLAHITKYCTGIFLGLALTLSALNAYRSNQGERLIDQAAEEAANTIPTSGEETPTDASEGASAESVVPAAPIVEGPMPDPSSEPSSDEAEPTSGAEAAPAEPPASETPELSESSESPLGNEPISQGAATPVTEPNPNN